MAYLEDIIPTNPTMYIDCMAILLPVMVHFMPGAETW